MTKTFCFYLHSSSAEMGGWPKAAGGGLLSLRAARKNSRSFVGKKPLTQERRINGDCNNPCYKRDEPSFAPPAASLESHQGKLFGHTDSQGPSARTVSHRLQEVVCNVALTFFAGDLKISMPDPEQNPLVLGYPVLPQAWLLDQS